MSKIANMLNMVKILENMEIHSIKELSKKLEVSERMIRVYKDELEQSGIYINSIRGIYGGYRLDEALSSINIGLTDKEIELLDNLNLYLIDKKDFKYKNEYYKILRKIEDAYKNNLKFINKEKLNKIKNIDNSIQNIYKDMRNSINQKNKVFIKFYSVNSKYTERIIHPAELFCYNENWYVAAYCELRNEIRLFDLKNIKDYKILNEKYSKEINLKNL